MGQTISKYLVSGAGKEGVAAAEATGEKTVAAAGEAGTELAGTLAAGQVAQAVSNVTLTCDVQGPSIMDSIINMGCSLFEAMGISMAEHGIGGQTVGVQPHSDLGGPH